MNYNISQFSRTERLIGEEASKILKNSNVAVFGIGGVGGMACEALVRAGIGKITIVDSDDIDVTNINRQIIALNSTIGKAKVEVMEQRLKDINPEVQVAAIKKFYLPENREEFSLDSFDYIVDAIDTVSSKIDLIEAASQKNTPIISSMGTGNKLNPALFEIADITKTSVCPLAKIIRKELRNRGIKRLKVVYSKEEPIKQEGRTAPASISFVPPVAGLIMAGAVINDLIGLGDK